MQLKYMVLTLKQSVLKEYGPGNYCDNFWNVWDENWRKKSGMVEFQSKNQNYSPNDCPHSVFDSAILTNTLYSKNYTCTVNVLYRSFIFRHVSFKNRDLSVF